MTLITFALVLIFLHLKHYLMDCVLQNSWIRNGKKTQKTIPLMVHLLMHGLGSFIVLIFFFDMNSAINFAILDMFFHGIIDLIKAHPRLGSRWGPDKEFYWWSMMGDQTAHHISTILILVFLFS